MRSLSFVWKSYTAARQWITISADFYIAMAAGILLLPLQWICAWLFSAVFHEICHYFALRHRGKIVTGISVSLSGIKMHTEDLDLTDKMICAYAGPVGALFLLIFAKQMPRVAVCTIVQSIYNLLPVSSLDGGLGLRCVLMKLFGDERGFKAFKVFESFAFLILIFLALYAYLRLGLGLLPAVAVVFLIFKNKKINIPCKKCLQALQ